MSVAQKQDWQFQNSFAMLNGLSGLGGFVG